MVEQNKTTPRGRKTEERLKRNRWIRATQLIVITLALLFSSNSSLGKTKILPKESNELIINYEGFRPKPYKCAGGGLTIGYGTQISDPNMVVTKDEAKTLMETHLDKYVRPYLPKLPLGANQVKALESLVYNIGVSKWNQSTLKKCIESNNTACIKTEWMRWVYVAGKKNSWQVRRRTAELNYYLNIQTEKK